MPITHRVLLLLMATFASRTLAQVLTDMCYWASPRAASIKGGLYANGGQWLDLISSPGIQGFTYFLNYSESFNTTGNIGFSSLFTGPTAAGLTTTYVDGTMFANEDEYYLYGYVQYIRRKYLLTHSIVVPGPKLDHLFRRIGLLAMSSRPRLLHTLARIM